MEKCPRCKHKFAKYPLIDENGKRIWKNLFKMDFFSLLFLVIIVILIIGYKADIKEYEKVINDPYDYCGEYCIAKFDLCYPYLGQDTESCMRTQITSEELHIPPGEYELQDYGIAS